MPRLDRTKLRRSSAAVAFGVQKGDVDTRGARADAAGREQMAALPQARITFNYLGQFDQQFDSTALFQPLIAGVVQRLDRAFFIGEPGPLVPGAAGNRQSGGRCGHHHHAGTEH